MNPQVESYLAYLGRQDKYRLHKQRRHPHKKPMSKEDKNLAIRQAKKDKATAFHKLIALMEERAGRMHTIARKSIESLYRKFIHLRQSVNELLYKAIAYFNDTHKTMYAAYSKKGDYIKFTKF